MRGQTSENRYGNEFGTRATVSTNFAIAVHLMARCNIQTFVEIIHLTIVRVTICQIYLLFFLFFKVDIQDLDAIRCNKNGHLCDFNARSTGEGEQL